MVIGATEVSTDSAPSEMPPIEFAHHHLLDAWSGFSRSSSSPPYKVRGVQRSSVTDAGTAPVLTMRGLRSRHRTVRHSHDGHRTRPHDKRASPAAPGRGATSTQRECSITLTHLVRSRSPVLFNARPSHMSVRPLERDLTIGTHDTARDTRRTHRPGQSRGDTQDRLLLAAPRLKWGIGRNPVALVSIH